MMAVLRSAAVSRAVTAGGVDEEKEERAMGLLGCNVGREFLSVVAHSDTAKEAWESLRKKCEAHTTLQKLLKRQKYSELVQQERESVKAWGMRFARAVQELEDLGEAVRLEEKKLKYLSGLRAEFFHASQALATSCLEDSKVELEAVMERMEIVEQMAPTSISAGKKGSKDSGVPALSAQQAGGRGGGRGGRNGGGQRGKGRGRGGKGKDYSTTKCFNCDNFGHVAESCKQPCKRCGGSGHSMFKCPDKSAAGGGSGGDSSVSHGKAAFALCAAISPAGQQPQTSPGEGTSGVAAKILPGSPGAGGLVGLSLSDLPLSSDVVEALVASIDWDAAWANLCEAVFNEDGTAREEPTSGARHEVVTSGLALGAAGRPYDPEDFMLVRELYEELDSVYGPFSLDGAASADGRNAQHVSYCCRQWRSFFHERLQHHRLWCNPPFRSARRFIEHYLECKKDAPETTAAMFILPADRCALGGDLYPLVREWRTVRFWSAGEQLFTLPSREWEGERRLLKPCHFDVVALWDAPALPVSHALHCPLILDSGASCHMTGSAKLLGEFGKPNAGSPALVQVGNGAHLPVRGKGQLQLTGVGEPASCPPVVLEGVLHVEGMQHTLVSIPQLTARGAAVTFEGDAVRVTGAEGQLLLTGALEGQLFVVDSHSISRDSDSFVAAEAALWAVSALPAVPQPKPDAKLWHARLGHLGWSNLERLPGMVDGLDLAAADFQAAASDGTVCADCLAGRQQRAPRTSSTSARATRPLQRLHVDLCGPVIMSFGGSSYMMVVLDEATRYSEVRLLAHKSDAAAQLLQVVGKWERITGHRVAAIRSDRGGEWNSNSLQQELASRGIQQELTAAYSPESDGAAERLNRTLLEKVRAMLSYAEVPPTFWGECAAYANTLRNVSPVRGLSVTPHEAFHGTRPDVACLRVFGCLAYTHVAAELRKKLDSKTARGILLSVDPVSKLCRVWVDREVHVYRDVVCDETAVGWADIIGPARGEAGRRYGEDPEDYEDLYPGGNSGSHVGGAAKGPLGPAGGQEGSPANDAGPAGPGTAAAEDSEQQELAGGVDKPAGADSGQQPAAVGMDGQQAAGEQPAADSQQQQQPRRSERVSAPPERFGAWRAYAGSAILEPRTVSEAMSGPQRDAWFAAMQEEIEALSLKTTWELGQAPPGAKVLPCKWVFKLKLNADGSVDRYKARLVAGGHRQVPGVDVDDVFAPVARYESLRALLALVAAGDLELGSVDISNAFLNGQLEQPVYMRQPEMFSSGQPGEVCILRKTLYGLKQAPREWFAVLAGALRGMGAQQSDYDQALWTLGSGADQVTVLHWVDDLLIAGPTLASVDNVKKYLLKLFKGRDLGEATEYLGLKIERDRKARTLKISAPKHVEALLAKYGLQQAKGKDVPISPGADVGRRRPEEPPLAHHSLYMEAVGSLLYIAGTCRPDISLAVSLLAKAMADPAERHWGLLKGVLRYLAGTRVHGIIYGLGEGVHGYTDADYAGCTDTRRSRSGYVFLAAGGAVSWLSKGQPVVALSTAESEYVAAAAAAKEAVWLKRLTAGVGLVSSKGALVLYGDNQAALAIAANDSDSPKTKHIAVRYHFLRQQTADGVLQLCFVPSADNTADIFTKPLDKEKFSKFRAMLGVAANSTELAALQQQ